MENELVSVVMATFNGEKYIREQLDSILNQGYRHLEVIIVDDASTDATQAILEAYSHRDNRISIHYSEKNHGALASFEHGLELASGEFVVFADQDDVFESRKVSLLVEALKKNPHRDMAVSDLALMNGQGEKIDDSMWHHQRLRVKEGKPFSQLLYMNFTTGCAMMIRRRLLDRALPFPAGCIVHDWWLSVVCCSSAGGGLTLLTKPLTRYRQHGSNIIGSHAVSMQSSIERATNLESRIQWYDMNRSRLAGYLQKDIWNKEDVSAMASVKDAFDGLYSVSQCSLSGRLSAAGKAIHMARAESFKHRLGLVLFSLYPMLVDDLHSIMRKKRW